MFLEINELKTLIKTQDEVINQMVSMDLILEKEKW